MLCIFT